MSYGTHKLFGVSVPFDTKDTEIRLSFWCVYAYIYIFIYIYILYMSILHCDDKKTLFHCDVNKAPVLVDQPWNKNSNILAHNLNIYKRIGLKHNGYTKQINSITTHLYQFPSDIQIQIKIFYWHNHGIIWEVGESSPCVPSFIFWRANRQNVSV